MAADGRQVENNLKKVRFQFRNVAGEFVIIV